MSSKKFIPDCYRSAIQLIARRCYLDVIEILIHFFKQQFSIHQHGFTKSKSNWQ
jgi:hypothetical protein